MAFYFFLRKEFLLLVCKIRFLKLEIITSDKNNTVLIKKSVFVHERQLKLDIFNFSETSFFTVD